MNLRIIQDSANSASFNMAADQYLMKKSAHEKESVVVRFYSWKNRSITVGYTQKPTEQINFAALAEVGGEWIRRPTGGRAVLHYEDLTYSLVCSKNLPVMGNSIQESYALITRCLINGLHYAGIDCSAHDSYDELKSVTREIKLPCFLAPNRDEVMVEGKKLVGSAQKRTIDTILQHGSLPITSAYRTLPEYLLIDSDQAQHQKELLQQKSICAREVVPAIDSETLVAALKRGFSETLKTPFEERPWSEQELIEIHELRRSEEFLLQWCR